MYIHIHMYNTFEASAQVAKKTLQDKVDTVLRGIAEMQMEAEL